MKIALNDNSYIILEKNKNSVRFGIKTKNGKENIIISTTLEKDDLDKVISEMILLRTRINNGIEKEK